MKKNQPASQADKNIWDDAPTAETIREVAEQMAATAPTTPIAPQALNALDFDLEGLMTDFPTATDLERFVYDQTGVVLNLKGRANKLKYQIAMDVLNGQEVDDKFIGGNNPYIDKTELVPEEPLKDRPKRDSALPSSTDVQNSFWLNNAPHPDHTARAQDKKCHLLFRKYKNGMISYEIQGPLEQIPYGTKLDKFGRERPEIIKWLDPRTGEQVAVREDGTMTPQGKRLRAMMQGHKVNNSNFWDVFVDREFISLNESVIHNPWDLDK
jgi:hypothetical protein